MERVIEDTQIGHLLDMHPYDLSGGEQQRAALAKVLLLEPEILLLDEPTKGLDGFYKQKLADIFERLKKRGVTILMVSHDIEFCASYGDTCAMFFDGSVITSQSAKAFFVGNSFLYNSGKPDGETVISGCSNSKGSDRSMQQKQATGVDTKAMLPIFSCGFMVVAELFLPWFSMPVLKYSKLQTSYTLWNVSECVDNIQKSIRGGGKLSMELLTAEEIKTIGQWSIALQVFAIILTVLLIGAAIAAYRWKKKSVVYIRLTFLVAAILPALAFAANMQGNLFLNEKIGRESHFINLTIHSYLQLTAFPYAQLILALVMIAAVGKLLDTQFEYEAIMYIQRSVREDKKIGKRTKVSIFLILFAIPCLIFFGIFFLNDRSASFIALCIIGLAMIPFCMIFEDRKPQAREVLLIAVMAAIAVVGRMAFFMLPQFKPVTAIVIITGISLGAEAGFLTGAVAGFVSNFFFGQGPWTPWQMFAFGIIGFLAGLLFRGKREKYKKSKLILCLYGGIATLVIYGFLMDTSSITMFGTGFSWKALAAMYASGLPFNIVHGISTMVFLFFLAGPMDRKLERIKKKYGIL